MNSEKLQAAQKSITAAAVSVDELSADTAKTKGSESDVAELQSMSIQLTGMIGKLAVQIAKQEVSATK